jgi:hypothetical protein
MIEPENLGVLGLYSRKFEVTFHVRGQHRVVIDTRSPADGAYTLRASRWTPFDLLVGMPVHFINRAVPQVAQNYLNKAVEYAVLREFISSSSELSEKPKCRKTKEFAPALHSLPWHMECVIKSAAFLPADQATEHDIALLKSKLNPIEIRT